MTTAHESLGLDTRLPGLDVLRFVAALSVVFYHLTYSIDGARAFTGVDALTRYGYLGVDLFFIISGFVILWSAQGKSPSQFLISRFSRLYPLFWVAILITVAVLSYFGTRIGLKQMLLNATMLGGYLHTDYIDGVYWTLQIELKFYVMIFLLLIGEQIGRAEQWIYGWLALTLLNTLTGIIPNGLILYPYSSYFIAGMLFFQIWSKGVSNVRLVALILAFCLSSLHAFKQVNQFVTGEVQPWVPVPVLVLVIVHLLLLLIATRKISLRSAPLWTWLGALTYPLYLLHNRIGHAIFTSLPMSAEVALLITLLAVASLTVVATLLDRRLHRWTRDTLTQLHSPRTEPALGD